MIIYTDSLIDFTKLSPNMHIEQISTYELKKMLSEVLIPDVADIVVMTLTGNLQNTTHSGGYLFTKKNIMIWYVCYITSHNRNKNLFIYHKKVSMYKQFRFLVTTSNNIQSFICYPLFKSL